MVVMAIATIGFLQTVQYAATRMHNAKSQNGQMMLAMSLMEDAVERDLFDTKNGDGVDEGSGLNWSVEVTPDKQRVSQGSEQPALKTITVQVWKTETKKLKITSVKWAER